MQYDKIIKASLSYERKYKIRPDILFLGQKDFNEFIKSNLCERAYYLAQRNLDKLEVAGLKVIRLNAHEYFNVCSEESLRQNRLRVHHYPLLITRLTDGNAVPQPSYSELITEEIMQFEIDAYQKFISK